MRYQSLSNQRGVITIFVAMVLLIFITLMVITAFSLSTMNLRAVGNVQTRMEAIAAAEKSIELIIDTTFWNPAIAQSFDIDIDKDSTVDYKVDVAVPTCVRYAFVELDTASSVTLPGFSSTDAWNTFWELNATAINNASGTRVMVSQGVRVLMSETDKNLYCI
jgi:uncharacterized membrane protein (DUF485 family)